MITVPISKLTEVLEVGDTLGGAQLEVFKDTDLENAIATESISTLNTSVLTFDYTPPQEPCSIRVRLITSVGGYQDWTPITKLIQNARTNQSTVFNEPTVTKVTFRDSENGVPCMNTQLSIDGNCPVYIVIIKSEDGFKSVFETNGKPTLLPKILTPNTVFTVTVFGRLDGYQSIPHSSIIHTVKDRDDSHRIVSVTKDKVTFTRPLGVASIEVFMYRGNESKHYIASAGGSVLITPELKSNEITQWSIIVKYNYEDGSIISIGRN